jgi:hypothetical protein
MPRPKKVGNTRDVEQYDTLYWCGLIKAQSGLSDAQIEVKLNLVVDPTGRSFNRWLTGKRAMSHDKIQEVVKKARKVGLLGARRSLGTHLESASEQRACAGEQQKGRASEHLAKAMTSVRELHEARRALDKAAIVFQNAATAAGEHGVDIFDTITAAQLSPPDDELLEGCQIEGISKKISEIASWYFFQGVAHTLVE